MRTIGNYYLTDKVLGKGSNATVLLGCPRSSPEQKVAIKVINKQALSEDKKKELNCEIEILQKVRASPFVVHLLDIYEDEDSMYLVFEYKASDLYNFIKKFRPLPEAVVRIIFTQVLEAMRYCHALGICHRDLKIENILIDEKTLAVSVCDFGFATYFEKDQRLSKWCGSPHSVAPEIILRKAYSPVAVDLWALGSILYTLLCGSFPFMAKNFREIFRRTTLGLFHDFPPFVSQTARDLVTTILKTRPEKRPSIDEILAHPFFVENR